MTTRPWNPYVGLRPFESDDARCFFGRDGQVEPMLTLLESRKFMAVVGVSGSGKSSLVKAGLVPALHAGALWTGRASWVVVDMKPRQQPVRNLAEALAASPILESLPEDVISRADYAEAALRHSSAGLAELISRFSVSKTTSDSAVLVIVDQFEELFRFARLISEGEADEFVQLLLSAASETEVPVYVVLTMRSDFLGDCARFRGLPEQLNRSQFLIPRLERDDLRDAIEGPAALVGSLVEPDLVTRLLNDLGEEPNRLPLLQHALRRIWELSSADSGGSMKLADYEESAGTMDGDPGATPDDRTHFGALHRHAQSIYDGSGSAEEKRKLQILFQALTETAPGNLLIRRPCGVEAITALLWPEIPQEDGRRNLGVLTAPFRREDTGFLTPASPPDELLASATLDISHESLISHWKTLERWVREEAADARFLQNLMSDMERNLEYNDQLLERTENWWRRRQPSEQWVERYLPGKWEEILAFRSRQDEFATNRNQAREEAKKSKERNDSLRFWLVVAVMAAAGVGTAVSLFHSQRAVKAKVEAEESREDARQAFSQSFYHRIGSEIGLDRTEEDALWELIELPEKSAAAKELLLKKWLVGGANPIAFLDSDMAGIRAAAGLDRLAQYAGDVGVISHRSLMNPKVSDPGELQVFVDSLSAVSDRLSGLSTSDLLDALVDPDEADFQRQEALFTTIKQLPVEFKDADLLKKIVDCLPAVWAADLDLFGRMVELMKEFPKNAKTVIAKSLASTLADGEDLDTVTLAAFVAISDSGNSLYENEIFIKKVFKAVVDGRIADRYGFEALGTALNRIPDSAKDRQFAMTLLNAFLSEERAFILRSSEGPVGWLTADSSRMDFLADVLAGLPGFSMDSIFVQKVQEVIVAEVDPSRSLTEVLAQIFKSLPDELKDEGIAVRLRDWFIEENELNFGLLSSLLELPGRFDHLVFTSEFSDKVVETLLVSNVTDPGELEILEKAVKRIPMLLTSENFASSVLEALVDGSVYEIDLLDTLVEIIGSLDENLKDADFAERIIAGLLKPEEIDPNVLSAYANIIRDLPDQMKDGSFADEVCDALVNKDESDRDRLIIFGRVLKEFPASIKGPELADRLHAALDDESEVNVLRLIAVCDALKGYPEEAIDRSALSLVSSLRKALQPVNQTSGKPDGRGNREGVDLTKRSVPNPSQKSTENEVSKLERIDVLLRVLRNLITDAGGSGTPSVGDALIEILPILEKEGYGALAHSLIGVCVSSSDECHPIFLQTFLDDAFGMLASMENEFREDGREVESVAETRARIRLILGRIADFDLGMLVDVLKWPNCSGEAQDLVLEAIENSPQVKSKGHKFEGNLFRFVSLAPSLGVSNLNSVPRRPKPEFAIEIWRRLREQGGTADGDQ